MSWRSYASSSNIDGWNQAKGYLDIGEELWRKYYEASLTDGVHDDVECLKRLIDHYSAKFRAKEEKIKKENLTYYEKTMKDYENKPSLIDWFLNEVDKVESLNTQLIKKGFYKEKYVLNDYKLMSTAKRNLRSIARELLLVCELLNLFDISRNYGIKKLTDDIDT